MKYLLFSILYVILCDNSYGKTQFDIVLSGSPFFGGSASEDDDLDYRNNLEGINLSLGYNWDTYLLAVKYSILSLEYEQKSTSSRDATNAIYRPQLYGLLLGKTINSNDNSDIHLFFSYSRGTGRFNFSDIDDKTNVDIESFDIGIDYRLRFKEKFNFIAGGSYMANRIDSFNTSNTRFSSEELSNGNLLVRVGIGLEF